jgi:hypothetical protein
MVEGEEEGEEREDDVEEVRTCEDTTRRGRKAG